MADHAVRIDPPGLEQLHQGALERENDGLGQLAFIERRLRDLETGLTQRGPRIGAPVLVDCVDGAAEHRMSLVETASTAGPLSAPPGEHHRQPPLTLLRQGDGGPYFREGIQRFGKFLALRTAKAARARNGCGGG